MSVAFRLQPRALARPSNAPPDVALLDTAGHPPTIQLPRRTDAAHAPPVWISPGEHWRMQVCIILPPLRLTSLELCPVLTCAVMNGWSRHFNSRSLYVQVSLPASSEGVLLDSRKQAAHVLAAAVQHDVLCGASILVVDAVPLPPPTTQGKGDNRVMPDEGQAICPCLPQIAKTPGS